MKRFSLLLSLIATCSALACQKDFNLSQVQWVPTMEDVLELDTEEIKLLVFFLEDPMHLDKGKGVEKFEEIGRLVEPRKIEMVMETIEEDSTICGCEDECAHIHMWLTWMGVVNKDNQGFLINIGLNHSKERVEWWARYSNRLYDVLVEYGIIEPPKKHIFVNEPNLVHFKAPPQPHLRRKPRVITTFLERDLDQIYMKVEPNTEPVYVKVDPNSPEVYIAVDSNLALMYVRELLPAVNAMKEQSEELMDQSKWLIQALDRCLKKLEAEKGLQPIITESEDYMKRIKPSKVEPLPYTKPQIKPLPEIPDISRLRALMNLHCLATSGVLNLTRENIKSFEERMKRLEAYLEK